MKFLIVEDDFAARKLLQTYLSVYGECAIAVNGREAIEAFSESLKEGQSYDLICLDVMMPEMDGYEALKAIRQIEKERGTNSGDGVKVIMTTALSDFENIASAFRSGCESYLVKPIRKDDLLDEMEKLGITGLKVTS